MLSALRRAARCSSDPVCAMRTPSDPEDFLHGAACHCCSFASETSCEKANRFLDRRFLLDPADSHTATPCPGSSGPSMPSDPFADARRVPHGDRGRQRLAAQLSRRPAHHRRRCARSTPARRDEAKQLLAAAGLGHADVERSVAVLHAIAGAKAVRRDLTPVWTMPGNEADDRPPDQRVPPARQRRPPVGDLRDLQLRADLADVGRAQGGIRTARRRRHRLRRRGQGRRRRGQGPAPTATVYRSATLPNGKRVVSHAKFVVIDHEVLLLTSANFSFSAENRNVEFGLLVHDAGLCESVETTMTSKHGTLYELV